MPLPRLRRPSSNGTAPSSRQGRERAKAEGWDYDGKTPPEVLRGRSEFHRAFSGLTKGKRNWQVAAFFAFAVLALAVAGLVTLAAQSRVVPYVVEVDRLGRASAIAPAEAVPAVADRVVIAALSAFVSDIRTVYADPVAQRDAVYRAYAYVGGDARAFLEAYFSDPQNDPRRLGTGARRSVEVVAVIPVPGAASGARTYRVTWNETESSPQRGDTERAWEGYLSVVVAPPTTTEGIERNPLGVFVTDLSWSPLAGATEVEDAEPETPEAEPDESPALRGVLALPTPEPQPTARPDTLRP
ncbi:type IV secretion system protein [Rubrivirga sp. S365]|uniref:type IV secretion system protein n=1 Tax=Rubrivirga sp. S365 TaxID=3076080 RepID=UPI0028C8F129|nr:type IV secretion system protein [Rubrivirga sp. S365]MDT7858416.1 type IV secretion system protein [Rubrivirga sp. S365]